MGAELDDATFTCMLTACTKKESEVLTDLLHARDHNFDQNTCCGVVGCDSSGRKSSISQRLYSRLLAEPNNRLIPVSRAYRSP